MLGAMRVGVPILASLTLLLACDAARPFDDGTCSSWMGAIKVGTLEQAALDEVSGLAVSHRHEDTVWLHLDHGGHVS